MKFGCDAPSGLDPFLAAVSPGRCPGLICSATADLRCGPRVRGFYLLCFAYHKWCDCVQFGRMLDLRLSMCPSHTHPQSVSCVNKSSVTVWYEFCIILLMSAFRYTAKTDA